MKNIILIAGLSTLSLVACKQRSQTGLETSKDLIILTDSSKSYLSDTGVVSSGAERSGTIATPVAPAPAPAPRRSSTNRTYSKSSSGSGSSQSSAGTGTSTAQAPQAQKKGMSKAAKGAIIGGVGGAAAGAVIGKNVKGAVIGGAVGAAGGYIIGRSKDRKDGRVQ